MRESTHSFRGRAYFFNANDSVCRQAAADLGDAQLRMAIATLKTGERYVKDGRSVYHEYVPLLKDPWAFEGLGKKKTEMALERIYERPEYYTPQLDEISQDDASTADTNESASSDTQAANADGPSQNPHCTI
jgi:hypothetical protein